MHPAQIKALLTIAGYKQKDAAEACGVTPTAVSTVIAGRNRSKQVEDWIAEATGRTLLELWPQWYGEGELVLTDDERALVRAYRDLSAADRARAVEMLKAGSPARSGIHNTGTHARIAGGDYHEGTTTGRRKK